MIIELLTTLRGNEIWGKGRVFDDSKEPIPPDILKEAELNTGTVKVIKDKPEEPASPFFEAEKLENEIEAIEKSEEIKTVSDEFICNICGREFKNEHGLKIHKLRMHK